MVMVTCYRKMALTMRARSLKAKDLDKVYRNGQMARYTMASGLMISCMELGF